MESAQSAILERGTHGWPIEGADPSRPLSTRYLLDLDAHITAKLHGSHLDFAELTRSCCGAWPALIAERCDKLGLWSSLAKSHSAIPHLSNYDPELHQHFSEWYFEEASAQLILDAFADKRGFNLMLGTPTVAVQAYRAAMNFELVDSNPLLKRRFNRLIGSLQNQMVETATTTKSPSSIILDPPWYVDEIRTWLSKASTLSTNKTKIVMPLLPEFTKPTAWQDRESVLEFASRIGKVSLERQVVRYESPLFEREALRASNVIPAIDWRCADLLMIENPKPIGFVRRPQERARWESFTLGSQVVQLKNGEARLGDEFLIAPVHGTHAFVLDTVSRGDPRLPSVDIWTSRNRVARVGDFRSVRELLIRLSSKPANQTPSILHSLESPTAQAFRRFLCWDNRGAEG